MRIGPDDRVLEIGPGSSDSLGCLAGRLTDGRVVGLDRSAAAIERAAKRHAAHIDSGRLRLVQGELGQVRPQQVLAEIAPATSFGKILAVNVNVFWTRKPTAELALIEQLLSANGALYLCYGYGEPAAANSTSPKPPPDRLLDHLEEAGFTAATVSSGDLLGVIATPLRSGGR